MNNEQVHNLLNTIKPTPELIETHISWVILTSDYVYKIKKPVHYDFLDFSTLEKRKFYCEREVELNRRLTRDIYLEVVPIYQNKGEVSLSGNGGNVIEYAVKMRKIDPEKRMDLLLEKNQVTAKQLEIVADLLIRFHNKTTVLKKFDFESIQRKFNALGGEVDFVAEQFDPELAEKVVQAMVTADNFIASNRALFKARLRDGYMRDCHGDLHSRNIFLNEPPIIFDCIEFNDDYRYMDVLSEVAFLCMDLDASEHPELAEYFFDYYNGKFNICDSEEENTLFTFYKAHYANVRAKVNLLRLESDDHDEQEVRGLVVKYIQLMDEYLETLKKSTNGL